MSCGEQDLCSKIFPGYISLCCEAHGPSSLLFAESQFWHKNETVLLTGTFHGLFILIFHWCGVSHRSRKCRAAVKWLVQSLADQVEYSDNLSPRQDSSNFSLMAFSPDLKARLQTWCGPTNLPKQKSAAKSFFVWKTEITMQFAAITRADGDHFESKWQVWNFRRKHTENVTGIFRRTRVYFLSCCKECWVKDKKAKSRRYHPNGILTLMQFIYLTRLH